MHSSWCGTRRRCCAAVLKKNNGNRLFPRSLCAFHRYCCGRPVALAPFVLVVDTNPAILYPRADCGKYVIDTANCFFNYFFISSRRFLEHVPNAGAVISIWPSSMERSGSYVAAHACPLYRYWQWSRWRDPDISCASTRLRICWYRDRAAALVNQCNSWATATKCSEIYPARLPHVGSGRLRCGVCLFVTCSDARALGASLYANAQWVDANQLRIRPCRCETRSVLYASRRWAKALCVVSRAASSGILIREKFFSQSGLKRSFRSQTNYYLW